MVKIQHSSKSNSSRYLTEWLIWLKHKSLPTSILEDELRQTRVRKRVNPRILLFGFIMIVLSVFSILSIVVIQRTRFISEITSPDQLQSLQTLPFRGVLKDQSGNPISTRTDVTFTLYDSLEGGNILYSGNCFGQEGIEADYNGSFIVVLGSDCAMKPIPKELMDTKNPLYLGVRIGSDQELKPRYQIRSTSFSENASLLNGMPPGSEKRQIPFIDSTNSISLTDDSPQIISTNGNFSISGPSLSLKALDQDIGDVIVLPASGRSALFPVGNVGIGVQSAESTLHISSDDENIETVKVTNMANSVDSASRTVLSLSIGTTVPENNHFITFNAMSDDEFRQIGSIDQENDRIIYRTSGADFAEYFAAIESIPENFIVGLSSEGVRKAHRGDRLIGVVTTTAGFVGNAKQTSTKYQTLVGLVGQLQVLVSDEDGSIQKADSIGVSSVPGIGSRTTIEDAVGFSLTSLSDLSQKEYSQQLCPKEFKSRVRLDGKPIKCAYIFVILD